MADNSFLDFVASAGDYIPGGRQAIPSWLTALLVKNPGAASSPSGAAPYFQSVGESGAAANQFADDNTRFFNENYRPAAVQFGNRAQGIGGRADLDEAAARGGANFQQAFNTRKAAIERDMRGVDPNSGAAMARQGAMDASYAPGLVDSMNRARMGREEYGDKMRATAMPFLATKPDYRTGGALASAAGAGMLGIGRDLNEQYRQRVGDVTKTLKMPGDAEDNAQRTARGKAVRDELMGRIDKWFGARRGDANVRAFDYGRTSDDQAMGTAMSGGGGGSGWAASTDAADMQAGIDASSGWADGWRNS